MYIYNPAIHNFIFYQIIINNWAETCSWNYNLIKYKVVYDCIIYILYYILAYLQAQLSSQYCSNGDDWHNFLQVKSYDVNMAPGSEKVGQPWSNVMLQYACSKNQERVSNECKLVCVLCRNWQVATTQIALGSDVPYRTSRSSPAAWRFSAFVCVGVRLVYVRECPWYRTS